MNFIFDLSTRGFDSRQVHDTLTNKGYDMTLSKESKWFIVGIILLVIGFVLSMVKITTDYNAQIEESKEIKRLSLVDYTTAFVIETNEILIIDRKTNEVKFVLTDTLAIQILTAKEFQLQVMEYEEIISK